MEDRNETQLMFKDLMDSSKRMALGLSPQRQNNNQYSNSPPSRNYQYGGGVGSSNNKYDPYRQDSRLRIESQFEKFDNAAALQQQVRGPNVASGLKDVNPPFDAGRDELGKIEALISDF